MPRFQAQTNPVLDQELEDLRQRLGLRSNQRADLLRELAALAGWVVRQAQRGRSIEARRGREVEELDSALLERLRRKQERQLGSALRLDDEEVQRLAEILDRGYAPTPALRKALSRLGSARRRPPRLRWKDAAS
jgi:hypothetical protein